MDRMPDYLSSVGWRMSGGVFGQPPHRPYFQPHYARKQYPTRTGRQSVAIGERNSAPVRMYCLLQFHCLLTALYLRNIHCTQLGNEGRGRMRKFQVILCNEVRTNLSLKKDTPIPLDSR